MSEAPEQNPLTFDELLRDIGGADRVVIETKNALGEMDAHYIPAQEVQAALSTKDARIAELEGAIKRQAGASKTLREFTLAQVKHIEEKDRSKYSAAKTLDSERCANAIPTDEIEALQARVDTLVDALSELARCEHWPVFSHGKAASAARAAIRAQEGE